AAEMQVRDGRRPRIDIRGKKGRYLGERVDEGALARFDLSDDSDAANLLAQQLRGFADEALPCRLDNRVKPLSCFEKVSLQILQAFTDAAVPSRVEHRSGVLRLAGTGRQLNHVRTVPHRRTP